MSIFRPAGGFNIVVRPAVEDLVKAQANQWPRLPTFFHDIITRLAMTGHREGVPVAGGKPGWRLFVAEGDQPAGLPKVKVIYRPLGDTLTIYMVVIG